MVREERGVVSADALASGLSKRLIAANGIESGPSCLLVDM
jgi:hypothetical protein